MHKMRLNRLELGFTIRPVGPILLKSGIDGGMTNDGPNMEFMTTEHRRGGKTVFLPGSSLKGVIRSHAERISRTVGVSCCDPLDHNTTCNNDELKDVPGPEVYQESCTICRLFGSTNLASHFVVQDAYPPSSVREDELPVRNMVAINRRTGAVANPFRVRVNTRTPFEGAIVVENFERWQLGLLALVLRDIGTGVVRIGHGKTRGLGRVSLAYRYLCVSYPQIFRKTSFGTHLYGVAELANEPELSGQNLVELYDWQPSVFLDSEGSDYPDPDQPEFAAKVKSDGWGQEDAFVTEHHPVEDILRLQVGAWQKYVESTAEVPYEN